MPTLRPPSNSVDSVASPESDAISKTLSLEMA